MVSASSEDPAASSAGASSAAASASAFSAAAFSAAASSAAFFSAASLSAFFFAVMASFTNLALSASQLGTKYLNQLHTIAREVRDAATGVITTPADYSELGTLLVTVTLIGLALPLLAILFTRLAGLRSA